MPTKVTVMNNYDQSNPTVQSDFVFVNGVGQEVLRGVSQTIRPVYQEIIVESQRNVAKTNQSDMHISGKQPQVYNSI